MNTISAAVDVTRLAEAREAGSIQQLQNMIYPCLPDADGTRIPVHWNS